jgi:para-nitrobenzyl esterase
VTVFGQSAGAFSVCQHLVMPSSNGLFSHAAMESGDCDGPWLIADGTDAKAFGSSYSSFVGCPPGHNRTACLRSLPLSDLMTPYTDWFCRLETRDDPWCVNRTAYAAEKEDGRALQAWPRPVSAFAPLAGWTAVVDGNLLPDTPINLINQGKINLAPDGVSNVSVILGTNQDEMALFIVAMGVIVPGLKLPASEESFSALRKHLVQYHSRWNATVSDAILSAYPRHAYNTQAYRIVTAGTDFTFRCGTRRTARALSSNGILTFLYNYAYQTEGWHDPSSLRCELEDEIKCGVYHAAEVSFVFDSAALNSKKDRHVASALSTYWTNLATYGSPNAPNASDAFQFWTPYSADSDLHLEISGAGTLELQSGLARERCDFWDQLPSEGPYPH